MNFKRLLSLALGASVTFGATVQADERVREPAAADRAGGVLDEFTDLNTAKTTARLAEFKANPRLKAALNKVSAALAKNGVTAKQVEGSLLPLVKDRAPADVEVSLAAVMRHHLDQHLKTNARASEKMVARDDVLTTAAFGATNHKPRRRAKLRKRLHMRR